MGDNKVEPVKKSIPPLMNFVIGGTSGMMAICVVQPMDLLKTRLQLLGPQSNTTMFQVASDILKKEGFKGFYNGLSAALFRQATYTTGRLGAFNCFMDMHKKWSAVGGLSNISGKEVWRFGLRQTRQTCSPTFQVLSQETLAVSVGDRIVMSQPSHLINNPAPLLMRIYDIGLPEKWLRLS